MARPTKILLGAVLGMAFAVALGYGYHALGIRNRFGQPMTLNTLPILAVFGGVWGAIVAWRWTLMLKGSR